MNGDKKLSLQVQSRYFAPSYAQNVNVEQNNSKNIAPNLLMVYGKITIMYQYESTLTMKQHKPLPFHSI
jgi:hypothetical protein